MYIDFFSSYRRIMSQNEDNSRFRAMQSVCKIIIDKTHFDEVSQRFPEVMYLLSVLDVMINIHT